MAYKQDVAGGLMSPRFARVRPDMTVDEAIVYLRRQAKQVDLLYYAYVLDETQRLLGVLSFRELFAADGVKAREGSHANQIRRRIGAHGSGGGGHAFSENCACLQSR